MSPCQIVVLQLYNIQVTYNESLSDGSSATVQYTGSITVSHCQMLVRQLYLQYTTVSHCQMVVLQL